MHPTVVSPTCAVSQRCTLRHPLPQPSIHDKWFRVPGSHSWRVAHLSEVLRYMLYTDIAIRYTPIYESPCELATLALSSSMGSLAPLSSDSAWRSVSWSSLESAAVNLDCAPPLLLPAPLVPVFLAAAHAWAICKNLYEVGFASRSSSAKM